MFVNISIAVRAIDIKEKYKKPKEKATCIIHRKKNHLGRFSWFDLFSVPSKCDQHGHAISGEKRLLVLTIQESIG